MTTPNIITSILVAASAQFGAGQFDLCALADVQAEFTTQTGDAAWLTKSIVRESAAIANYCNRIFQVQTYQTQFWPFRDSPPRKFSADLLPLQLPCWPLAKTQSQAGIAPPQAPALSSVSGGSLAAARYYVRASLVTAMGETPASLESNLALAAGTLLQVASPAADPQGLATGWNCYISTAANIETLQNSTPIAIGTSFTLPGSGLVAGAALPNFVLVTETCARNSISSGIWPLAENVDFTLDLTLNRVERLHRVDGLARSFSSAPIVVQYKAGFAAIPDDIQDAAIQLVKLKYFARDVDPAVRERNVEGVYSETRWFGTGPGGSPDMPNYVTAVLDRYRVPVVA